MLDYSFYYSELYVFYATTHSYDTTTNVKYLKTIFFKYSYILKSE